MSTKLELKEEIKILPDNPGIYKYFNVDNEIIYIGKAKNIKKRVSNYFLEKANHNYKTQKLVSQINRIEFTVVDSELDALLLENNLIKNHQPKYNILLKDDKTYPYLCISNERFPRIYSTRKLEKREGTHFGPYTSGRTVRTLLELFQKLFTIRNCEYNLSKQNIENNKFKVCLEYHIGNCKGPCIGNQEEIEYLAEINIIKNILNGYNKVGIDYLTEQMNDLASKLLFEEAQKIKSKIEILQNYQAKSLIVSTSIKNLKVLTVYNHDKKTYVNYLKINNGQIIETQTYQATKMLDETDEEILEQAIIEHIDLENEHEIVTNIPISFNTEKINCYVPKIGDKKKLIELSIKNIFEYIKARAIYFEEAKKENIGLLELQKTLNLKELPIHMECFDNSNIQGTNPVSAMVCFKDGKPAKKEYRHYHVKTVIGPNDFDTMYEVVYRRYKRLKEEQKPLPNLIIIDGGKGQLGKAVDALKDLELYGKIPIISIAKRLEEIFVPGDEYSIMFNKKSEGLKLLQQIRNESHRFGITFHRNLRSKQIEQKNSMLDEIKGIGTNTKQKIQTTYKTIKYLLEADEAEVIKLIGRQKLNIIKEYIKQNNDSKV
jgi:excinuclease ABC subunit C